MGQAAHPQVSNDVAARIIAEQADVARPDVCWRCGVRPVEWSMHDQFHAQIAQLYQLRDQLAELLAPNPGKW